MNNKSIDWRKKKLKQIREEIESGQLNALRELVPNQTIEELCEAHGYRFRKRLMSPVTTILHMVNAAISREGSFQSAWESIGQTGRSGVLAEARRRIPYGVWQSLEKWMIERIYEEDNGNPKWRGHRMIGVDGTGVTMSDEPELRQYFGRRNVGSHVRGCGEGHFPVARVVSAFNLQTLIHVGHEIGDHKASERVLFRQFLPRLGRGDVAVFDRLYAGGNLYAYYQRAGIEFIGGIPPRLIVERLKVLRVFAPADQLVEMGIGSKHRKKDSTLPKVVTFRLIETTIKSGGKTKRIWIATSLLNPAQYPADEIRLWHKRRWKVETLLKEAKILLGANVLRSKSVEGIYKELCARLIALNLLHWLILKSSRAKKRIVDAISLTTTVRLVTAYSLKMSVAPMWYLPRLYDQLLEDIARAKVMERPERSEPRMIRRDEWKYPRLQTSRAQWRKECLSAA